MVARPASVPVTAPAVDRMRRLAKAALVAGADGLMIEMHPNPRVALSDGSQALTPFRLKSGHFATRPDQVVIDAGTASKQHVGVGGQVRIEGRGPVRRFTVAGIATFGAVDSIGSATFAVFDLRTAQRLR